MRDGVKLRADVLRPAATGPIPDARLPHAVRPQALRGERGRQGGARPRLRRRPAGRARAATAPRETSFPTPTRARTVTTRSSGRPPSPGRTATSARSALLSGRGAVAGRRRGAAAPEGDGPGDDVLLAAKLLLCRRGVGSLLARRGSGTTSRPTRACSRDLPGPRTAREARDDLEASAGSLPFRLPLDRRARAAPRPRPTTSTGSRTARGTPGGTGRTCAAATGTSAPPC